MPSWSAFAAAAPDLAATVRARLDAHPYKLLATLRKDGSPAKLADVALPTTGPREGARYYRLDLREVATVGVGATGLAISVWTPERGVRSWTR